MPKYRLLSGTFRREDGTKAEPGDIVELDEEVRERFSAEQFRPVDTGEPVEETSIDEPDETTEDSAGTETDESGDETDEETPAEASGDVPTDWELLRSMAIVYDGDEVNGATGKDEIAAFFADFSDTEIADIKRRARNRLEE